MSTVCAGPPAGVTGQGQSQALRLLALDTSTERMSVAACRPDEDGSARLWRAEGVGGAAASRGLLPMIRAVLAQAGLAVTDLDAIVFGRGPGAFTGLRAACAVAQGLALGGRAGTARPPLPVLPLDSLLALAEVARWQHAPLQPRWDVLAMLDARMDELYLGRYRWDAGHWQTLQAPLLGRAQDLAVQSDEAMAGNVFETYGARLPPATSRQPRIPAWPMADAMLRLAPALLTQGLAVDAALALPLYVRDKVAFTTQERAQARVAPAVAAAGAHR